jgi:type III secretory pathway component EscS
MNRVKPSFWLFLSTKLPPIFLPAIILCFVSLPSLLSAAPQYQLSCIYPMISIIIILFGLLLLVYWKEFKKLSSVFKNGVETIGKIVNTNFNWAAGYIEYEYEYQQGKYRCRYDTVRNKKTNNISVGQQVILYINKEDHWQAFIRNLYLNTF